MLLLGTLAIPIQLGLAGAGGALAPGRGAWLTSLLILLLPFTIPAEWVPVRGCASVLAVALFMRCIDLMRESTPQPWASRVLHALSIVDLRVMPRVAPRLDLRMALAGWGLFGLGVCSFFIAAQPATSTIGAVSLRWAFGLVGFYLVAEGANRSVPAGYLLGGVEVEPIQRQPIMSLSLAEFWGIRWNAIVRRWLASVAYLPLARKRPRTGIFLAFALSAAIHAFIVFPGLGWQSAAVMGSFFLIHGGLVLCERAVNIRRWPRWASRFWTIGWMMLTFPLFLEPLLRLMGFPPVLDAAGLGA